MEFVTEILPSNFNVSGERNLLKLFLVLVFPLKGYFDNLLIHAEIRHYAVEALDTLVFMGNVSPSYYETLLDFS